MDRVDRAYLNEIAADSSEKAGDVATMDIGIDMGELEVRGA